MQTTYEEYKEWTEDGELEPALQAVYEKARDKAVKLMPLEDKLVSCD